MGVTPVFDPKRYPDINQQLAPAHGMIKRDRK
jgi:hypothetical protein